MIENLIEDLAHSIGSWAYLLVAVLAMAETAAFLGFVAPGEIAVIIGGVLAGEGTLSIVLLIGIVWAAVVAGDTIGFLLGQNLGRTFMLKHGHRLRLTEERLRRVEVYFARHGGKTIFAGRWIGFVRPLMPFTAGASGMPYRRFIPYDVLGAGTWGATFCLLGYLFWQSFTEVTAAVGRGAIVLGAVVALAVCGTFAFRRLRRPEQRRRFAAWLARQGRRPLLRPLAYLASPVHRAILRPLWRRVPAPAGRRLGPPLRFLGQRLTPGELGIELTTLLAVTAVCGYVFGLYVDLITESSAVVTPGDRTAQDIAHGIQGGALTAVAKAANVLGEWKLASVVLVAAAVFLALRRRLGEALVLVGGFAIAQVVVSITKEAIERPRPGGPLVEGDGFGFPSGHAATAAAFVALAVMLARTARRASLRLAVVVVAASLAALIGLSRVYLRVHYLSDVTSGWALALALFALCGSAALVVHYLRNNRRSADDG